MLNYKEILRQDVLNPESITMAGEDFIVMDEPKLLSAGRFPYKNEWLIATLCEAGSASGTINLRDYKIGPGGFIIILPGQLVAHSEMSAGFRGKIVLMSSRFAESLNLGGTLALTASIEQRPYYRFPREAIDIVLNYIASCKTMIRMNGDTQLTREVLRHLSTAFFMGAKPLLAAQDRGIGPYSKLTDDFLTMVEREYRTHRQLDFYADALGRNVKYLSRRIKEDTGRNATDWIDRCVILDAQAQLVSTKKTVQEISDSLGFPSQSFFGKYYKRVTGLSPKEFRKGL